MRASGGWQRASAQISALVAGRGQPRPCVSLCYTMLVAVVLGLAGCAGLVTPGEQRKATALFEATDTYRKLMRWGQYAEAVPYLKKRDGTPPAVPDLKRMQGYRISGWQAGAPEVNAAGDEASVGVTIEFYEVASATTRTVRDEQLWWYDATDEHWFLATPMPVFWRR